MMRFLKDPNQEHKHVLMLFDVGALLESEINAIQTTKRGKRAVKVKYLICKDFSNHGLPRQIHSLCCLT